MTSAPVLFAKATADDTRQEIMKYLCWVWLSVGDIVDAVGGRVNQLTVCRHLRIFADPNLVKMRQEGRQRF